MILLALVALRMISLAAHGRALTLDACMGLVMLIVAAALTIVLSLFVPKWALLAYLVNLLDGPVRWVVGRRSK